MAHISHNKYSYFVYKLSKCFPKAKQIAREKSKQCEWSQWMRQHVGLNDICLVIVQLLLKNRIISEADITRITFKFYNEFIV